MSVMKDLKQSFHSKATTMAAVLSGLIISVFAVAALNVQPASAQAVEDCTPNSVIRCGAATPTALIAKIKANNPNDLKAIYHHFNLPTEDYDRFAREAKVGKAYKDGRLVVDGQVVATDIWSIGREAKSYSKAYKIGDTTYHRSLASDVFNRDSLDAFVAFNNRGQVAVAVLAACGNPMGGKIVTPTYACNQLKRTAVAGQKNTYRFTTDASAAKGATISRVVYDFGDGSAPVTKTKLDDAVTHAYTKNGNFTAKVTVYVKLPGGKEVAANGSGCAQRITVKQEVKPQEKIATWQCTGLTATPQTVSDNSLAYTLRANAAMTNARLVKADFDFGDGVTQKDVIPASADSNTVSTNHTYGTAGTYTAKATLYFEANAGADGQGKDTSVECQVTFTTKQPVTPAGSGAAPAQPQELPKTGLAGAAGLFTGASVLGSLGYRWHVRRRLGKVDQLIDNLKS